MVEPAYAAVVSGFRGVLWLLGLRPEVRGLEHLPRRGGAVLVANHTSYLDFVLLGGLGRERGRWVRFLAKSTVFDTPLVGAVMRRMRHVPVTRAQPAGALREAQRLLASGEVVGVFAEGTISRSFLVKRFHPGAAAMCIGTGAPLVPVVSFGAHRYLTVDGRLTLRRRIPVVVRVGEPLPPRPDDDPHALTAVLHSRMTEMLHEVIDGYPRDRAGGAWWLPSTWGGGAPTPDDAARLDDAALARLAARTGSAGRARRAGRRHRGAAAQDRPPR